MRKRVLLSVLLACGMCGGMLPSYSADAPDGAPATAADMAALPLDDLHDVGYILQLIRQQAVDIYAEATQRKADMSGTLSPLNAIPEKPLLAEKEYKPIRKAWIVFFIGTMEPLLHLLQEAYREVKSGEVILKVPESKKAELKALEAEMGTCLASINKHLDNCAGVLDSNEAGNLIVASEAAGISADAAKAETIRERTIKMFGNLGAPGTYEMNPGAGK